LGTVPVLGGLVAFSSRRLQLVIAARLPVFTLADGIVWPSVALG